MKIEEVAKYFTTGWIAMDKDWSWYWYAEEPYIRADHDIWCEAMLDLFVFQIPPVDDWKQSLVQIKNGKVVK